MDNKIQQKLLSMTEKEYAEFSRRLVPNIDPANVLGIRVPKLRALAKEISSAEREAFLHELPHSYHEENMLHALLINDIRSCEDIILALDAFLPRMDNWAVCDCLRPSKLKNCPQRFVFELRRYMISEHGFTVRFAVEMLMTYFLDELYSPEYPAMVSCVRSEDYYVNMMLAWYFATALAKRWDEIIPYIEKRALPPWVHNRTIQKARESFRISQEHKDYLKTLRI